jgi:valyl-tRNA synthetase
MLGDVAIAVNPSDARHKELVGTFAILPLVNKEIPIIADDYVDPAFGTGMVKITPAHDPNDYWVGQRHNLPTVNVFTNSAAINENAPEKYRGMDRYEARKAILADLEAAGLLVKIEEHIHNVGRCYRCETVIEPYLSDQWFVKMKPLAERALAVVQDGTIRFHPDRWARTYEHWMTNIRDWCISRQLWWGHRIPVWYCAGTDRRSASCDSPIVTKTPPAKCPHCGSTSLRQDEDVLDTWFSSWLWPFSTFGWPDDNKELRYFYPTDTLVTGPDIIFFWVARMIMAGLEVMPDIPLPDGSPRTAAKDLVPFRDVYFTSIIRDEQGRKMSKSLGNSPDPLDVISDYGADALRFTVIFLAPLGQDVLFSSEKCEIGRNFANKIWNAGRFLLMNQQQIGKSEIDLQEFASRTVRSEAHLDLADRWILSRLHSTIAGVNASLTRFDINQASKTLYEFAWHDFCDWYVEMIKGRLYGDEPAGVKQVVLARSIHVFDTMLRLLHPFMPFLTEELWHHLDDRREGKSIMVSPYPVADDSCVDRTTDAEMSMVQNVINGVRNVRGELSVPPSKEIRLVIRFADATKAAAIGKYLGYFQRLARVTEIVPLTDGPRPPHSSTVVVEGGEVYIPLEGLIDLSAERERVGKEITRVKGMIEGINRKLTNASFVDKAPREIVDKEREKLVNFQQTLQKLETTLGSL